MFLKMVNFKDSNFDDKRKYVPYLMLVISLVQVTLFVGCDEDTRKLLRFDPDKKHQIWRYLTYMLLHDNVFHLSMNIILQCFCGLFLEKQQGRLKIGMVYAAGGITGALATSSLTDDEFLIGASAGVHSLLLSLVAELYLNYKKEWKILVCGGVCITVLILFANLKLLDQFWTKEEPLISWRAHLFGALSGLILGFALYIKTQTHGESEGEQGKKIRVAVASFVYLLMCISLVIITIFR